MNALSSARLREVPVKKTVEVKNVALAEEHDGTEKMVNRLFTKRFAKKALGLALIAVAGAVVAEVARGDE